MSMFAERYVLASLIQNFPMILQECHQMTTDLSRPAQLQKQIELTGRRKRHAEMHRTHEGIGAGKMLRLFFILDRANSDLSLAALPISSEVPRNAASPASPNWTARYKSVALPYSR